MATFFFEGTGGSTPASAVPSDKLLRKKWLCPLSPQKRNESVAGKKIFPALAGGL
jgi:hypothetical protein